MKMVNTTRALAVLAAGFATQAAVAGSHQNSLDACKAAAMEAEDGEARVRLSSLERRGSQYRFWLDVYATDASGQKERKRAYCTAKGSNVQDLVSSEGKWDRTSKREVVEEVESRMASSS